MLRELADTCSSVRCPFQKAFQLTKDTLVRNFSIYSRICPHLAALGPEGVRSIQSGTANQAQSALGVDTKVAPHKIIENPKAAAVFHGASSFEEAAEAVTMKAATEEPVKWTAQKYADTFQGIVDGIKEKGNYRVFADLERQKDKFPKTIYHSPDQEQREVVGWCSNDYLCMGQHPKVVALTISA